MDKTPVKLAIIIKAQTATKAKETAIRDINNKDNAIYNAANNAEPDIDQTNKDK